MNFLQLCQRLRQECGGSGVGPASVIEQSGEHRLYVDWIRQAWLEIQNHRPNWLFLWDRGNLAIKPGTQFYSLPAEVGTLEGDSLRLDGRQVELVPYKWLQSQPVNSAIPKRVSLLPNGQLMLESLPGQAMNLDFEFFVSPKQLTSNTDIPALPEQFHMLIVYLGMQFYGAYEGAGDVYSDGRMKFETMMTHLEREQLPSMTFAGAMA